MSNRAWVPFGGHRGIDQAAALAIQWLEGQAKPGAGWTLVVAQDKQTWDVHDAVDTLARSGGYSTKRSSSARARSGGGVLAFLPDEADLVRAQRLAGDDALAVVQWPGTDFVPPWVAYVEATDLTTGTRTGHGRSDWHLEQLGWLFDVAYNGYGAEPFASRGAMILDRLSNAGELEGADVVGYFVSRGRGDRSDALRAMVAARLMSGSKPLRHSDPG